MYVLLFDDECLVCNRSIQFLLARDGGVFKFAALQGDYGRQIVQQHQLEQIDSVILVEGDRVFTHSTAVLRALRFIPKWRLLTFLRFVPKSLRDIVYNYIARHRHRLPLKEQCLYLTNEQRRRFLQ